MAKTAAQAQPAAGVPAPGAAAGATAPGIFGTGGLAADILSALGGANPDLGQAGAGPDAASGAFAALLPGDASDAATAAAPAAKPGDAKLAWAMFKTAATTPTGGQADATGGTPAQTAADKSDPLAAALAATLAGAEPARAEGVIVAGQASAPGAKTADADKKDSKASDDDAVSVAAPVPAAGDLLPAAMAGASLAQAGLQPKAAPSAPNTDVGEDKPFFVANQAKGVSEAAPNATPQAQAAAAAVLAQADDGAPASGLAPQPAATPVQGQGQAPDPAAAPVSAQQALAAAVSAEAAPPTAPTTRAGRPQARTAAAANASTATPADNGQTGMARADAVSATATSIGAGETPAGRPQPMTVAEAGAAANLDNQARAPALAQPQGQSAAAIAKGAASVQATGPKPGGAAPVTATQGQTASAQTASIPTASAQAAADPPRPDASVDAAPAPSDPGLAPQPSLLEPAAALALAPAPLQTAATATQAAPETVARLATQIVQTAQGPASQFNLTLHPAELGGVQVKIQVDKNGQVSASLSFDNPQAAADLSARADELRAQLSQAGFDVADGGLSFSLNGQGQQTAGDNSAHGGLMGGRAFRAAAAGAEDLLTQVNEAASRLGRPSSAAAGGLDIRI